MKQPDYDHVRVGGNALPPPAVLKRIPRPYKVFALNGSRAYGEKVANHLNTSLTPHTEKLHEDGEPYIKSGPEGSADPEIGNVRGHDVFVICSLFGDATESVCDKLVKLCMFIGSLKDASAHEVTAVIPHLAWARQDRKTESRAPIATKYVAKMLEAVGVSRCLFMDVHNLGAEQNAFSVPIDNLEATGLMADWSADWCSDYLVHSSDSSKKIKVLSPDAGGLARCTKFRDLLLARLIERGRAIDDIEIVVFDKVRVNGKVTGGRIIGDVDGACVFALDDMISTAGTIAKAAKAVKDQGGDMIAVLATHGIFCGNANDLLPFIGQSVVVADTVDPWRVNSQNLMKLRTIDTTKLMAEAIRRIHCGTGSISQLLG